ncbi:phosphopantetheine-binding protein [Micromonospora tarensis]|uniref:Acyl carrier protein n=1 Tax=Micromonospora tarensis TaxID=2806100 RepID=A0ABS1YA88_9ACTN|nr:phosphopantetheine-binding protein [Micromonospora tarensis]MBM0274285.1 acyl carrier protein [Micromonospora tarensis]
MSSTLADFDAAIATYAIGSFDDTTLLPEAGIDSLSLLRLAVRFAGTEDAEIDAARLVEIRSVGDLKAWLHQLASTPSSGGAPSDGR